VIYDNLEIAYCPPGSVADVLAFVSLGLLRLIWFVPFTPGTKRLRCGLEAVADGDVLADAGLTADTDPGKAGETDATPGVEAGETGENDPETDIKEEMDRLTAATPATGDGGGEE
jgi:hypothetical protein